MAPDNKLNGSTKRSERRPEKHPEKRRGSLQGQLLVFILRWLLPVGLTVALVWYLFSKVQFAEMVAIVRNGCDWWWILAAMLLSVVSHIIRAARWQLQLRPLGITPSLMALSCSVFGCYALNLLFPRLGEVWRCTFIAKRQNAPFTTVIGTMVADRLADTLAVLLLTLLAFILAAPALNAFLAEYPIGRDIETLVSNPFTWIIGLGALAAMCLLIYAARNSRPVKRLRRWIAEMWHGFASTATMPHRSRFILLTLLLWGCYYIQLYVALFAFPFTRELCHNASLGFGLTPALVAFVLSSIGMAVPSNGGLGPWNIAVMFGLAIYGIGDAQGTAFSMVQWSGQTVMLILLGIFTMGYISFSKNPSRKK